MKCVYQVPSEDSLLASETDVSLSAPFKDELNLQDFSSDSIISKEKKKSKKNDRFDKHEISYLDLDINHFQLLNRWKKAVAIDQELYYTPQLFSAQNKAAIQIGCMFQAQPSQKCMNVSTLRKRIISSKDLWKSNNLEEKYEVFKREYGEESQECFITVVRQVLGWRCSMGALLSKRAAVEEAILNFRKKASQR